MNVFNVNMIRTTAGDVALMHETCLEYLARRLSEGWRCIDFEYPFAVLLSPGGIRRELDLRNDVETLRPNAAGDETNITSQYPDSDEHWDKVAEDIADEDDTYIYHIINGYLRDLYNLPPSSGTGTINKITVYFRFRSSTPAYIARAKGVIKSNGIVSEGAIKVEEDTSYVTSSEIWVVNPADSQPWEWADIDALQIGVTMRAASPLSEPHCTQVYVEVDYTLRVPRKEIYYVKKAGVRQDLTSPTPDFEVISTGTRQDL